jgi:hypothetical protein
VKTFVATEDSQRECWYCGMPENAYAGAHALFPLGPDMPRARVIGGAFQILSWSGGGRIAVCLRCARQQKASQ